MFYPHLIKVSKRLDSLGRESATPTSSGTQSEMVFAPESRMVVCCLSEVGSLGLVPYWHELQLGVGAGCLPLIVLFYTQPQSGGPSSKENGIHNLVHVGHV